MSKTVVITRHNGAVEWLLERLDLTGVPILSSATPDDVAGRRVIGNVPLHLAALAESVTAIEFAGDPPRGAEYTAADMTAAGARLVEYTVRVVPAARDICVYCGTDTTGSRFGFDCFQCGAS